VVVAEVGVLRLQAGLQNAAAGAPRQVELRRALIRPPGAADGAVDGLVSHGLRAELQVAKAPAAVVEARAARDVTGGHRLDFAGKVARIRFI